MRHRAVHQTANLPQDPTPRPGSWLRCTAPSYGTVCAACEVVVQAFVADPIVGLEPHRRAIAPFAPLVASEVVVAAILLRLPTGYGTDGPKPRTLAERSGTSNRTFAMPARTWDHGVLHPFGFVVSRHNQSPGFQGWRSSLRPAQKTQICFQRGLHPEHVSQTQALSAIFLFKASCSSARLRDSASSSELPDSWSSSSLLMGTLALDFGSFSLESDACSSESYSSQASYFAGTVPLV